MKLILKVSHFFKAFTKKKVFVGPCIMAVLEMNESIKIYQQE